MVDTYVSGAYEEIREGSSPFSDIIYVKGRRTRTRRSLVSGSSAKELRAKCFAIQNWFRISYLQNT